MIQQVGTAVPSPTPPTTITKRGGEDIPAPSPSRSSLVNTEGAQMEQFAREPRVEEWIEDKPLEVTPPSPTHVPNWTALTPTQITLDENNTEISTLSQPTPDAECEYNRRGVCRLHKTLGIKTVRKSQVWVKKKFGYGYVTKQKTVYHCNTGKVNPAPRIIVKQEVSVGSPVNLESLESSVISDKGK